MVLGGITFKLFASVPLCVLVLVDIKQNLYLEKHGTVAAAHDQKGVMVFSQRTWAARG